VDSFELFNQYYPADRHWAAYLAAEKGLRFTNLTATSRAAHSRGPRGQV
jgi:hypothetical protein